MFFRKLFRSTKRSWKQYATAHRLEVEESDDLFLSRGYLQGHGIELKVTFSSTTDEAHVAGWISSLTLAITLQSPFPHTLSFQSRGDHNSYTALSDGSRTSAANHSATHLLSGDSAFDEMFLPGGSCSGNVPDYLSPTRRTTLLQLATVVLPAKVILENGSLSIKLSGCSEEEVSFSLLEQWTEHLLSAISRFDRVG